MDGTIVYVELKTGFSDNGPAWIGRARCSRTGCTIYFDGKALKRIKGGGVRGNYREMETGKEYWISKVKRDQADRHWAGSGKIFVDRAVLNDYLTHVGLQTLDPQRYKLVQLDNSDIREKVKELENRKGPAVKSSP